MFGIGFFEIVVIAIIALLVFGPKRLPEIAHTLGTIMRYCNRNWQKFKNELYQFEYNQDIMQDKPSNKTEADEAE